MTASATALTDVKETLLLTLHGKASESRLPDSLLGDRFAAEVVGRLDHDLDALGTSRDEMTSLAMRARTMDDWCRDFIVRHEDAAVLHLGCGLDSRVFRVDPPTGVHWVDLDFPEVVTLRKRLYPPRNGCTLVGASALDPGWLADVPGGRPAMIAAEGMLVFLGPEDVHGLLARLTAHFPSGELVFDGFNRHAAGNLMQNPRLKATGARLSWMLDDPRDLEAAVPALRFVEAVDPFDPASLARMSWAADVAGRDLDAFPAHLRPGLFMRYRFG